MGVTTRIALVVALALSACANARTTPMDDDDAPVTGDGGVPDAPPAAPAGPVSEIVTAAGRVRAGARVIDMEIGLAVPPTTITAGSRRLTGITVVQPRRPAVRTRRSR